MTYPSQSSRLKHPENCVEVISLLCEDSIVKYIEEICISIFTFFMWQACGCGTYGAMKLQCEAHTGRCSCREGYQGERCNVCSPGYFGYPRCQRCDCNPAGTMEKSCDAVKGHCLCDESGQCPCKVNIC